MTMEEDDLFSEEPLQLPSSSTDLPVPKSALVSLVSIYRALADQFNFSHLVFEDFLAALSHREHSSITSDVHIALLDVRLSEEVSKGSLFSAYELLSLEKLDEVTWPCALKLYLKHTNKSLCFSGDYYLLDLEKRVQILLYLTRYHTGLTDCSKPQIHGTTALGEGSAGARFWFTQRRLIVWSKKDVNYYSCKDKLDEVLLCLRNSMGDDSRMHDIIKESYFEYVERMNETLVDFVFAYKTALTKSVQSPTKYSGITYGEQSSNTTLMKKDVENMAISSLLASFKEASAESFTFGSDKLFLKYKVRKTNDKLIAAISDRLREMGESIRDQLTWKSSSPDQIKLLRNAMLNMSSNISKHFMHDAWSKRAPAWESALLKAANSHQLAACLAFLESHIRPVVFSADWTKIDDSAKGTPKSQPHKAQLPASSSIKTEVKSGSVSPRSPSKDETKDGEAQDDETKKNETSGDATMVDATRGDTKMWDETNDECQAQDSPIKISSKRKNHRQSLLVPGEDYRQKSGLGWTFEATSPGSKSVSHDRNKRCERLTRLVNKLQCTKGVSASTKRVISMPHGFKKTVGPDGKVMFALPPGARILPQKGMTQVILSAKSLHTGRPPTTVQVIPSSDQLKPLPSFPSTSSSSFPSSSFFSTPSIPTPSSSVGAPGQRNIVLSNEVVKGLLSRADLSVRGNVTLKRRMVTPSTTSSPSAATALSDDPAQLLQRLFQSWPSAQGKQPGDGEHSLPELKKRKLGRCAGGVILPGYLYSTLDTFCAPNFQNRWRSSLRQSQDVADIGVLVSMLHSHVRWSDLRSLKVLTDNKYLCNENTMVQRIIVDSRNDKGNVMAKQFKIVVMKQDKEGDDLLELSDSAIKVSMKELDVGVHDIWVSENMVTFNETYTYLFNQDKLKSIESAKIMEEKNKNDEKVESDTLLPRWKDGKEEIPSDKYLVDSEISTVVRRVLTNILDRVEMEDMRDKERIGKKRKAKKQVPRVSGRSVGEKEQIKYLSKLDILLGRRKEQLKKTFFKKRQYLAHMIREEIKFEEAENKRIADKIRREEEEELAHKRKKNQEADRRKKEKEKKIRKAQDKIEKKLQRLQKNVDEIKTTGVAIKKTKSTGRSSFKSPGRTSLKSPGRPSLKSPGRPSLKSPGRPSLNKSTKSKKSSIRIESHHVKPVFKNKLQPKTKFKFPPKKPAVKKSSNKLSLTPSLSRTPTTPVEKPSSSIVVASAIISETPRITVPPPSEKLRIRLPSTDKPRDINKILGKRKIRPGKRSAKKLCIEIKPIVLSKRKRESLEERLNKYQRTMALSLTSNDLSHPVISMSNKRSTVSLSKKHPTVEMTNTRLTIDVSRKKPAVEMSKRRSSIDSSKKKPTLKLKQKSPSSSVDRNTIRERLQKLRKIASAKNRGNEVLAKLLMKQEFVKKLTASSTQKEPEKPSEDPEKEDETPTPVIQQLKTTASTLPSSRPGVIQHHKDQTNKSAPKKKDTLYCICKRPYDHTRFYIGCDVCSNWYHGKCVAISPSMARNMSGYTCADCKAKTKATETAEPAKAEEEEIPAEPEGDLFCICRTPYNQYSFYIGCDSCQEWYHGTCVGISEMEAEKIEVYICDRCKQQQGREEPKLTHIQIAGLIKILRELQMHKMSWPFREPAKTDTEQDIIKEPMDLSTIHKKFQKKHYPKLTLFVKDVLRVFSNARQLYSEDSQRGRCADTLERYFVAKLNEFKLRHGLS